MELKITKKEQHIATEETATNIQHLVKVIIPIYKAKLNEFEKVSLDRSYQVLQNHPLTIIKPQSLAINSLLAEYPRLTVEEFNDSYFKSISGYNRLMLSPEFYRRFSNCQYILICQLDAYVFTDELTKWCDKDYDYIGAPWLVRPIYKFPLLALASWIKKQYCDFFRCPNSQITNFKVGNGGFSLRKVSSHLQATSKLTSTIEEYLSHTKNHIFNEDVFFSTEVNRHGLNFSYPTYLEALQFSFDKYPALCYKLNNRQLPFGCHSWYKRRMKKFWFPIIQNHSDLPQPVSVCKRFASYIKSHYFRLLELCFPSRIREAAEIPIIINNFNRLTTLKQLIASLEKRGYTNIHILDNNSSYPPLLEYYRSCRYEVIYLHQNIGFKALWKNRKTKKRFCSDYYIYTDSDVMLDENCPEDVINHLYQFLKGNYKYAAKIGLSLRIDDLPDYYNQKQKVIQWESRYYKKLNSDGLYPAPVDTTFALYRPRVGLSRSRAVEAYRTSIPYQLKHLPWYMDSANLSEEEKYYIQHCKRATSWSSLSKE